MTRIKKICSVMLSIMILCITSIPISAAEISPYEKLLQRGYTREFLNSISEEMLMNIYNAIEGEYVSETEETVLYLDENRNPYLPNVMGTINPNSLQITVVTEKVKQAGTNKISLYLYSAVWEWAKDKPAIRHKDPISLNWNNNIFSLNIFYAQDTVRNSSSNTPIVYMEYEAPAVVTQGGLGHYNNIRATGNFDYVGGGMLVLLQPNEPMYDNAANSYYTTVYFKFVHNRNPLGLGCTIEDDGYHVSINSGTLSDSTSSSEIVEFSR